MAAGDAAAWVERDEEAWPARTKALALRPDDFSTMYNVACYYSLAGDLERALDLLERALANGRRLLRLDPATTRDLEPLRGLPRFQQLWPRCATALKHRDARAATSGSRVRSDASRCGGYSGCRSRKARIAGTSSSALSSSM